MSKCFYRSGLVILSLVGFSSNLSSNLLADSPQLNSSSYIHENQLEMVGYLAPANCDENRSSGLDGVDCIYCINLDKRPERFAKCNQLFEENQLFVNRFSAVYGWKIVAKNSDFFGRYPITICDASWPEGPGSHWTRGQLGCALSHVSILQDAYNRGLEAIWILEDDVIFPEDPHKISAILERLTQLDPEWDVYYTDPDHQVKCEFSTWYLRPELKAISYKPPRLRENIDPDIMTTGFRLGNYSYICSRKGIKKLLDHFTKAYWFDPYDIEIHLVEGIREYSSPRNIVTMDRDPSCGSDTWFKPLD